MLQEKEYTILQSRECTGTHKGGYRMASNKFVLERVLVGYGFPNELELRWRDYPIQLSIQWIVIDGIVSTMTRRILLKSNHETLKKPYLSS